MVTPTACPRPDFAGYSGTKQRPRQSVPKALTGEETGLSDEAFNMSMRKFLKQVGVTSQQEIEKAMRAENPAGPVKVKVVLTIDEVGLTHTVEGEIEAGDLS